LRKLKILITAIVFVFLSCNVNEETPEPIETRGYDMLLIGNSFFKPYAQKLNAMASENMSKNDDYDPKDKEEYLEWYSKNVIKK